MYSIYAYFLCMFLVGAIDATFESYGTSWNFVGEMELNWAINPNVDLLFKGASPVPSQTFANTFDPSSSSVPWVIEDRSCDGSKCTKQIRITAFGASAFQTQTVQIQLVISGSNEAYLAPLLGIADTKFVFYITVCQPDGSTTYSSVGIDSWLEKAVFSEESQTQPYASTMIVIPPGTLRTNTVIRFQGFTHLYDLTTVFFTEGLLAGDNDAPKRGAGFGLRISSSPLVYRNTAPLPKAWIVFFLGADTWLHYEGKGKTNASPKQLGYNPGTPDYTASTSASQAFEVLITENTPVKDSNAFSLRIKDENVLRNQYLLIDFSVSGTSHSGKNRIFVSYVCINNTGAGNLCSIEPLVLYQQRAYNTMRNTYTMFLIPNQYLTTDARIYIYGDVYAGTSSESLNSQDPVRISNYVFNLRSEYYVYPN